MREHLRSAEVRGWASEHSGFRNASPTEDWEEGECMGELLLGYSERLWVIRKLPEEKDENGR